MVYIKDYYDGNQKNYLKIRLAAEMKFQMNWAVEKFYDENNKDQSVLKKLIKILESENCKFRYICRYYLLSLINRKKH